MFFLRVLLLAVILSPNSPMTTSFSRELKLKHGSDVDFVRFTPDGHRIISASFYGSIVMWDAHSGSRLWQADLDQGSKSKKSSTISHILGMAVSPDGNVVAVSYSKAYVVGETLQAKEEHRIGLLDPKTGRETKVLVGHGAQIGRLAFSPNGELLLSESGDSTARLWNVNTGQEVLLIKLKEKGASVAFSPNGKVMAVATQPVWGSPPQPIVGLYDVRTGQLLREFPRRKSAVAGLAFSPDGQTLAIASGDAVGAQIDLWELTSQDPKITFPMPRREIDSLAFSRNGRMLATGGYGNGKGFVEVREMTANTVLRTVRFESNVTALDFSPDGKRLVVGTDKGQIVVLHLQTR
ncbi:MAG: WD40 repeat domain-containing protein [Pyrinomonadaceae bacterium]